MGYRKKVPIPASRRLIEGRPTLAMFLKEITPRELEHHIEFMRNVRTYGVNEHRTTFKELLNTPVDERMAFKLGEKKKKVQQKMRLISSFLNYYRRRKSTPNREMIDFILNNYRKMIEELRG
jgi:hypothetical protein